MIRARIIGSSNINHYLSIERMHDQAFLNWETGFFTNSISPPMLFKSYQHIQNYKFIQAKNLRDIDFTNVDLNFLITASLGWPFSERLVQMVSAYIKEPQYGIRQDNLTITLSFLRRQNDIS